MWQRSMVQDLNLVRAFIAIYETRSVSKAASHLNVTQPTASHSLARLRSVLGDQLFVRTRDGMQPTAQAQDVYPDFVSAIRRIEQTIERSRAFDPATATRRFTLAMSDIGEMVFLPPILERLRNAAPNIEIEVVSPPEEGLATGLAAGEIAAAVGHFMLKEPYIRHAPLFTERYVCLLSRSNRQVGDALTSKQFVRSRHARVKSAASGHRLIEDALRKAGVQRRIALQIPHYAILPHIIAETDMLAIIPSRVAAQFEVNGTVRVAPIPFDIPTFEVQLHWSENDDVNTAHRWLRGVILDALRDRDG